MRSCRTDDYVEDAEIFLIRPGGQDQRFVKEKGAWSTSSSVKHKVRVQKLTQDAGGKAYPKDACILCGRSGHFARQRKCEIDIHGKKTGKNRGAYRDGSCNRCARMGHAAAEVDG